MAVGTEWTTTSAAGSHALDSGGGGHGDLLGTLEGEIAGHGKREVGEVAGAGAASAQARDGQDAGNPTEVEDELAAGFGGGEAGLGVGGACASSSVSRVWRASRQETVRMIAATASAATGSANSSWRDTQGVRQTPLP